MGIFLFFKQFYTQSDYGELIIQPIVYKITIHLYLIFKKNSRGF